MESPNGTVPSVPSPITYPNAGLGILTTFNRNKVQMTSVIERNASETRRIRGWNCCDLDGNSGARTSPVGATVVKYKTSPTGRHVRQAVCFAKIDGYVCLI